MLFKNKRKKIEINKYNVINTGIKGKFRKIIKVKLDSRKKKGVWKNLKNAILMATEESCEVAKIIDINIKNSNWWTDVIVAIKERKNTRRKYQQIGDILDHEAYRKQ